LEEKFFSRATTGVVSWLFFFSLSAAATFAASVFQRIKFSLTFINLVDFSAIGGRVVLAASAFRCAKTSVAFAAFDVPSVVVIVFPALPFLDVSAGSDPMFPAGCIFLLRAAGFGRRGHEIFISSKTRLTRPWCFNIF
jgi:hypothetical protein